MAVAVVLPKQGQSVESCVIANWKKQRGDMVTAGDILCEVETDKALVEVESPDAGVLLEQFFAVGDEVLVLTNIAAIGRPGEDVAHLRPHTAEQHAETSFAVKQEIAPPIAHTTGKIAVSPRARNLAIRKQIDLTGIQGSGPGGRIIERDVLSRLSAQPMMTPIARLMVSSGDFTAPEQGSGIGGRITRKDLQPRTKPVAEQQHENGVEKIALRGLRKTIAARMVNSVQTTAQFTLNAAADARLIQAYRQRLKNSPEALGLQKITLNDLVMFVVSRTLPQCRELNSLFEDDIISLYDAVHLGFAVDTPRGLIVPVISKADSLTLKQLATEAARLATACIDGKIHPDQLTGGTFTVSNLGSLGIESFTPILNPPQVGILGVGNVHLKPVDVDGAVQFIPHILLSLTVNHQVVDGAPAARFLNMLARNIASLDLLLAF